MINKIFILTLLFFLGQPAFAAPQVKEVIGQNGLKAWIIEDHSLPIISMKISFKGAGSISDYDNKSGLSNILASMLYEGAGNLDSHAFKEQLEEYAINLGFSHGKDNFSITLKTLSEYKDQALNLLTIALTEPQFSQESFTKVKKQTKMMK